MRALTVYIACTPDGEPIPLASAVGPMYIVNPTGEMAVDRAGRFGYDDAIARPLLALETE